MTKVKEINLSELKKDKRNANVGTKTDKLNASIKKLGLGRGILVDKDQNIIAGNHVFDEAVREGYTKAIIVPTDGNTLVITQRTDVDLDSSKGRSLAISDNVTAKEGIEFDFDVLDELNAEFDIDLEFMPDLDLSMYQEENEDSREGDNTKGTVGNGIDENENPYSTKIEAPIYEAKNEKPEIQALYKNERFNQLIEEVESSSISKEEKEFLKLAAVRHIVFNYELIADFYAHSSKECQELMENSALVIIDFNKAIELGYVRLSEQIANQYAQDYANTEGVEEDE